MNNEINYLKLLKELYSILKYTDKISMRAFLKSKGFTSHVGTVMINNGLLKTTGSKRSTRYAWNTIEPTLEMARELSKRTRAYGVECQHRSKEKKQANIVKASVIKPAISLVNTNIKDVQVLDYIVTEYLFGLISIKKQYHYKN